MAKSCKTVIAEHGPRGFYDEASTVELQLGSNYLGPFALTVRLLPLVLAAPAPRVVTMSSGTANYGRIHFDDLQWRRRYSANRAYAALAFVTEGRSRGVTPSFCRARAALAESDGGKPVSTE